MNDLKPCPFGCGAELDDTPPLTVFFDGYYGQKFVHHPTHKISDDSLCPLSGITSSMADWNTRLTTDAPHDQ